jgi:uncharacterized membrane protein
MTLEHAMNDSVAELAERLLLLKDSDLSKSERRVLDHISKRKHIATNVNALYSGTMSFGERISDKVAAFGGSWSFIIIFLVILFLWVSSNVVLGLYGKAVDPFPFIFLNLLLSMVAALQAPIIMMSQNRQAAKDRLVAGHDYEINLKAELEILALHEKMDEVRQSKLVKLMEQQEEQLVFLRKLVAQAKVTSSASKA